MLSWWKKQVHLKIRFLFHVEILEQVDWYINLGIFAIQIVCTGCLIWELWLWLWPGVLFDFIILRSIFNIFCKQTICQHSRLLPVQTLSIKKMDTYVDCNNFKSVFLVHEWGKKNEFNFEISLKIKKTIWTNINSIWNYIRMIIYEIFYSINWKLETCSISSDDFFN